MAARKGRANLAPAASIDIDIRCAAWRDRVADVDAVCRSAALAALAAVDESGIGCEIGIVLADDAFIRDLNRTWRGADAPTNVLAFPGGPETAPDECPPMLGDVVIAVETVAAEAATDGKTVSDHLSHLVVHGTLHLLGYDHEADDAAVEMEALEIRILDGLGIADPYGDPQAAFDD